MKRIIAASLVVLAFLAGCKEDPEQAANKLFVETASLWEQYQKQRAHVDDYALLEERLNSIEKIRDNLETIVSRYPESSLAVEMASTGAIRGLDPRDVDVQIKMTINDYADYVDKDFYKKARDGFDSEVLGYAEKISDNRLRAIAFRAIAHGEEGAGNASSALESLLLSKEAAMKIDDFLARSDILASIAIYQNSLGDVSAAKETMNEIQNPASLSRALNFIK